MSNRDVDSLVEQIVEIEKRAMHKKFDTTSGLGKQYAKDKMDSDVINSILSLLEEGGEKVEN